MQVTEIGIKEGRTPCCGKGCCQRDSAEHEGYDGVPTNVRITENNITNADRVEKGLLEEILSPDNLNKAYKRVKSNKGAHGVDGMEVEHLLQYLKDNGEELAKSILDGKYRPNPVRRVEIPKDNGKMRKLGIPTAVDRVVQQAIAQKLSPMFEPQFFDTSYGFRPNRSAHKRINCKKQWNRIRFAETQIEAIHNGMGELFQTCRHEEAAGRDRPMAAQKITHVYLEAMEKDTNQVCNA